MKLFVFGRGYSASHFLRTHRGPFGQVCATTRGQEPPEPISGVEDLVFDGHEAGSDVRARLGQADAMLVSIPPGGQIDPVLAHFATEIAAAPSLRSIVYLSTIGVYGDHGGAWVDESTVPAPRSARSIGRLKTENDWLKLGRDSGKAVHILRLAGIYGPGQNALENVRAGTARRLIKPGQVFNRIHVEDIARAIAAAFRYSGGGVWNVGDNEPAAPQDVIAYAAGLLGLPVPPGQDFDTAELTPMARSFYSENKRVSNQRLREVLGVELAYPNYREGIAALAEGMGGKSLPVSCARAE